MDSSSRDTLLKVFDEIIEWKRNKKRTKKGTGKSNWTTFQLSVVRDYVSKLVLGSDLRLLTSAKSFKDKKDPKIMASFMQELQEIFVVPKLHQLIHRDDALTKNELIAAFINFILQLLHHRKDSVNSIENRIKSLQRQLRFLLAVLGDTPLLCDDEDEQVQNLLVEFETAVNDAGSVVHSFVLSSCADRGFKTINERLGLLLKHLDLLKANICKFINLPPLVAKSNMTPKTVAVDSLFIVDSLLYDIKNLLNQDDSLVGDVKDRIKILQQKLIFSLSLLKGMNVPLFSGMEELKEHVIRIRDVAYEAEYLINSFSVGDAPLWYFSVRINNVIHRIKLFEIGLQETKNHYDKGAIKIAKNLNSQLLRAKRNSEVDDIVVGFEDMTIDILDQLVRGRQHLQIISIIGMPGLGKTTLAKKVYNHRLVANRFDKCFWCVVSQIYRRKSLLTEILINSTNEFDKDRILDMEEVSLSEHLYKSLKGRRYLIVMDDIWDSNVWHDLRRYFPDDGNGSRILFTSRNKDVAPPNSMIYSLPCFTNDQCWQLLEKKVFHNNPCPPELLWIGKKIAGYCRGLPLAVVVIAGILSAKDKKVSAWEEVGKNVASYISCGGNNSTMQILELSYKHLPEHLKPCFLYFGAFSEDEEIPVGKLMRLWIAEGFIHNKGRKNLERVAEEFLMELIDKSLVMVAKRRLDGGVKACVIHDLLRELCLKIAEEQNFQKWVNNNYSIYEKGHRLLSLQRSITPFGLHIRSFQVSYDVEPPFFIGNMKLLRVLDFQKMVYDGGRLIGLQYLVQLRYLVINELPSSIGSLVNLEYLSLNDGMSNDTRIPFLVLKMVKLRYLHFFKHISFDEDCNTSHINNLEVLSNVDINNLKDEEMLKCSPRLRKLKCLCSYRCPDLTFLTKLETLNMYDYSAARGMNEINLPSSIKKLTLSGFHLPCEAMSIIGGLPKLEVLKLICHNFVGRKWETKDDEFQQLRVLKLEGSDLAQWNVASSQHFPMLQQLLLHKCYNLQKIPCEISEIVMLQLIEVEFCTKAAARSARKIEKEQREMGNEELRIVIITY